MKVPSPVVAADADFSLTLEGAIQFLAQVSLLFQHLA
jgi:hypothetical protein